MRIGVVLPAGGRIKGEFAREAGAEVKALVRLGGRTILEQTITTLRATGCVSRVVVVGPPEACDHSLSRGADGALEEGEDGPENIMRGLEWLGRENGAAKIDRVLILATDLPFLTPDAILDYLAACPPGADVCVPIVRREDFDRRFPSSPATFVRLCDGEWTMACGFLVRPEAIAANRRKIERVFEARKNEMSMARLLGPVFVARYLTGRLTVPCIERRCAHLIRCHGVAVPDSPPEMAFDIDLREHYRYAAARLDTPAARPV